jgi:hypothetical protein
VAAIRIERFAGIAPRYSDRLLPPQAATIAANIHLVSGELRGLHQPTVVKDFSALLYTVRRAFRIPADITAPVPFNNASDHWVDFEDDEVDFVRSPVLGDTHERYYWTGDSSLYSGVPKYNTRARILASSSPYRLGVPRPTAALTVTPPAGDDLTRVYVYTFVSAYGEESAPSNPKLATGNAGTWALSGIETTVPNSSQRNITGVKIYRTVPGFSTTNFFFVDEISLGTSTYNDTELDVDVAQNPLLESILWAEPPGDLQGLTVHPSGFLVGFKGRDLYMSEPYRPHAWPTSYILTCQTEITGLAVFNNSVVVATNSHPYVAEGVHPQSMTFIKLDSVDPCVSRRSMATTLAGVMYASVQGIVLISAQGHQLATRQILDREDWATRYNAAGIKAAPYGMQYVAFDTPQKGFIFTPDEQVAPLVDLDRLTGVNGIQVDAYTGEVYVIQNNQVAVWNPPTGLPYSYQWKSKVFDLPMPVNLGALQVKFRNTAQEFEDSGVQELIDFNSARIQSPLNCLNLAAINAVRTEEIAGYTGPQNKSPIAGSPLFDINSILTATPAVTVKVYARMVDSTTFEAFSFTVTDEDVYRLPADFMSDVWQVEIISNTDVYSIALAETGKELARV